MSTTTVPESIRRRVVGALGVVSAAAGVTCWALGAGVVALWFFVAAAVVAALVLPLEYALVSPLYLGVLGWLVDMLPFVVLAGWTAVSLRWIWSLVRERRMPRGGRWVWLPVGLFAWTALGAAANLLMVSFTDWKHFGLLVGIQFLISAVILAAVDSLDDLRKRTQTITALLGYVVLLSVAVALQHGGVDMEELQDREVGTLLEEAYGVDAFENNIGMIKWARAEEAGVGEWRRKMKAIAEAEPDLPPFEVFLPKFHVYDEFVMIRFEGPVGEFEDELAAHDISMLYESVGVAPANLVPRYRSFPRNALTYAGICAALFPFALFLAWSDDPRRRLFGRIAAFSCLLGAGFALARGAWVAILLGVIYLLIDGMLQRRLKLQMIAAFVTAVVVLVGIFLVLYQDDPLTVRAGADSSIETREDLYGDTVGDVNGIHFLIGFGSERSRTADGDTRSRGAYGKYIPPAGSHSTYLNYLYRTGLVGGLGVIALYALSGLHARAAARERSGAERTYASLAAGAVLIAAAHAVILSIYVEPVYALVIALVLGLAMAGAWDLSRSIVPWKKPA